MIPHLHLQGDIQTLCRCLGGCHDGRMMGGWVVTEYRVSFMGRLEYKAADREDAEKKVIAADLTRKGVRVRSTGDSRPRNPRRSWCGASREGCLRRPLWLNTCLNRLRIGSLSLTSRSSFVWSRGSAPAKLLLIITRPRPCGQTEP